MIDNKNTQPSENVGWNCFDVAINLANRLNISNPTAEQQAKDARAELVKQALAHSDDDEYRKLLAPEIRHAAALTVAAMNSSELPSSEEYHLPLEMRSDELQELYNKYNSAENDDSVKEDITQCNNLLQFDEGHRKSFADLKEYFCNTVEQNDNAEAYEAFKRALFIVQPADEAFQAYCSSKNTYCQYIKEYYGANQWFVFQASFAGERSTSMVEITGKLLGHKISIHDLRQNKIVYETEDYGPNIAVNYNGTNHFTAKSQNGAVISSERYNRKRTTDMDDSDKISKKSANLPALTSKYDASGVKSTLHGIVYQLKILMLIAKRCRKMSYAFRLATEMNDAEKFDDAVLFFKTPETDIPHSIFLQAKHIQVEGENNRNISVKDLMKKKDDIFTLQKYFLSYQKIRKKGLGQNQKFIIYTNIDFDEILKKRSLLIKPIDVLKFERKEDSNGNFYSLSTPSFLNELKTLFKQTSEVNKLAKSLADHLLSGKIIKLEGLFKYYQKPLAWYVIDVTTKKLKQEFVNNQPSETVNFFWIFRREIEHLLKKIAKEQKPLSKNEHDIFCKTRKYQDEEKFSIVVENCEFVLSDGFQDIFVPDTNPLLTAPDMLAKEIAQLIKKTEKSGKNITIWRVGKNENKVINRELQKLAGHVLVKRNEDQEIVFNNHFLETGGMFGNIQDFRNALLSELVLKEAGELKGKLINYTFKIAKFETCYENELQQHMGAKPTFPEDNVADEEVNDFLQRLVFAVNQPNELRLSEIINRELGAEFNLINADLITNDFQDKLLGWFKEKEGTYISENGIDEFFKILAEKVSQLVLIGLTSHYMENINKHKIEFHDQIFCSYVEQFLKQSKTILNIIVESTLLGSIKLYPLFKNNMRGSYIFIELDDLFQQKYEVLRAFSRIESQTLVIVNNTEKTEYDPSDVNNELSNVMHNSQLKKIIFISSVQNEFLLNIKKKDPNKYQEYVDEIKFSSLSDASQNKILKKIVIFQGREVPLDQLIKRGSHITEFLPLADLLEKSTSISVGEVLPINRGYDETLYIDRTINQLISNNQVHHTYRPKDMSIFLQEPINQEIKIIVGTAGIGKSTALTKFSHLLKKKYPLYWITRIDLTNHTDTWSAQENDSREAVELLTESLLKLTSPLEKALFPQLLNDGKVIMMFDGFDEISPSYDAIVNKFLLNLKGAVQQIWVTTRPHLADGLLMNLKQEYSYSLEPFSEENQIEFLYKFWSQKSYFYESDEKRVRNFSECLIHKMTLSISDRDKELTGIPLQTRMLAEAFEAELKTFLDSEDEAPTLPHKLDLLQIYDKFVYIKYLLYISEKSNPLVVNVATNDIIEFLKSGVNLRKIHQKLAIEVLLPMFYKDILGDQKVKSFHEEKLTRIGIIYYTEEEKPQFIHRSFAEYYVADYFVEQLKTKEKSQKVVNILLQHIFLNSYYKIIANFMNCMIENQDIPADISELYGREIDILWKDGESIRLPAVPGLVPDEIRFGSILHRAAHEGNSHIIRLYYESLNKVCYAKTFKELFLFTNQTYIAWELAVQKGHKRAVDELYKWANTSNILQACDIKNTLFITKHDTYGLNVFEQAAENGHREVLEKLFLWANPIVSVAEWKEVFDNSSDINIWSLAARNGHANVLVKMHEWSVEFNITQQVINNHVLAFERVFLQIVDGNHVNVLKVLSKWFQDFQVEDETLENLLLNETDYPFKLNETAWHLALIKSDINMILLLWGLGTKELQKRLFNSEFKEKYRNFQPMIFKKVWHLAAETDSVELIDKVWSWGNELFSDRFTDMFYHDKTRYESDWENYNWALMCPQPRNSIEKEKYIKRKEPILKSRNTHDQTVFHLAVCKGRTEIIQKLWTLTTNQNILKQILLCKDSNERTALHVAAKNGFLDVVNLILEQGINLPSQIDANVIEINAEDKNGRTALNYAAEEKFWEIVVTLFKHGANTKNLSVENCFSLKNYLSKSEGTENLIYVLDEHLETLQSV